MSCNAGERACEMILVNNKALVSCSADQGWFRFTSSSAREGCLYQAFLSRVCDELLAVLECCWHQTVLGELP